jgi:hypothetical protein
MATPEQLANAAIDCQTIADVVNGEATRVNGSEPIGTVTTREGNVVPTLEKALQNIELTPMYSSTANGIAGTVDGEFFSVAVSPLGYVELYKNVAEVATLIGQYPSKALVDLVVSGTRLYFYEEVTFDPATRTFSFPTFAARAVNSATNIVYTPTAGTYDLVVPSTATHVIYLDLTVANDGVSNPFVAASGALTIDANKIIVGYYRGGGEALAETAKLVDGRIQYITREAQNVTPVDSNLPIIFIDEAGFGPAVNTWMVPITTRFRRAGTLKATLDATANPPSAAVDPTGTYNWTLYTEVACSASSDNLLIIDPGKGTANPKAVNVGMAGANPAGTKAGFIPLAAIHRNGNQLQALNGVRVIRVNKDPDELFGKVAALEAGTEDALVSNGYKLSAHRTKMASHSLGNTINDKLVLIGDSWFDRKQTGVELVSRLVADGIAVVASGWVSVGGFSGVSNSGFAGVNGENVVKSAGWASHDGHLADASSYSSPDGNALSVSSSGQTLNFESVKGSDIYLSYKDGAGNFRYRRKTGAAGAWSAWVDVAGAGSGNSVEVQIADGISTADVHYVDVETTSSGLVTIHGLYATSPELNGAEVIKLGNGGSMASHWANWNASLTRLLNLANPDVALIQFGTNEYRLGEAPATHKAGLIAIADAVEAANDLCGIVFITPPNNGAVSGGYEMEEYGAQASIARNEKIDKAEIVRFDKIWSSYAVENSLGMFAVDGYHLKDNIAYRRWVNDFYSALLKPEY